MCWRRAGIFQAETVRPGRLHGFARLCLHSEATSEVRVAHGMFLFFEALAFGYEKSLQEGMDVPMNSLVLSFCFSMRGALVLRRFLALVFGTP